MSEISWFDRGVPPCPEMVGELYHMISWDLFNQISKVGLVESEHESLKKEPLNSGRKKSGYAPFTWTFHAEKHSRGRWFLKKRTVQCTILRIVYDGEPRLLNGIYTIPQNNSLKCELFRNSPSIRNAVESVLGWAVEKIGIPGIEFVDMSNDPSAWYPGERRELPKAKVLKIQTRRS
jgi:hypothetical protein